MRLALRLISTASPLQSSECYISCLNTASRDGLRRPIDRWRGKDSAMNQAASFRNLPGFIPAAQVFLEIVMLGNLAEKSFALAATVIATLRATAL